MERKMASIRRITSLSPIQGADFIELAQVDGWKTVVKKGLHKEGDFVVYCEIDSWIPKTLVPDLSRGDKVRTYEGIEGERLRTIKLRGQISQGLIIPLNETPLELGTIEEGQDVSEELGIIKWEHPENLFVRGGEAKGNFPSFIRKTDQERFQNIDKDYPVGKLFEVTEKLEGSSMTCYLQNDVFGVCSRNYDLKDSDENAFWATAKKFRIEDLMRRYNLEGYALQGELVGPKIQNNIYGFSEYRFFVFDVFDIKKGSYMKPCERTALVKVVLGLGHAPILGCFEYKEGNLVEGRDPLSFAEGKSVLNPKIEREGLVFKCTQEEYSFKAISNKYLLKKKD